MILEALIAIWAFCWIVSQIGSEWIGPAAKNLLYIFGLVLIIILMLLPPALPLIHHSRY